MEHVLVPIDGDGAQQQRALAEAIRLHRQEGAAVCLLSVQPALNGHVASHFPSADLHRLQLETGRDELAPACALLKAAGVQHQAVVRVGRRAETIARTARELGCERIVLGNATEGFNNALFGSIQQQVKHLLAGAAGCHVIGA